MKELSPKRLFLICSSQHSRDTSFLNYESFLLRAKIACVAGGIVCTKLERGEAVLNPACRKTRVFLYISVHQWMGNPDWLRAVNTSIKC